MLRFDDAVHGNSDTNLYVQIHSYHRRQETGSKYAAHRL